MRIGAAALPPRPQHRPRHDRRTPLPIHPPVSTGNPTGWRRAPRTAEATPRLRAPPRPAQADSARPTRPPPSAQSARNGPRRQPSGRRPRRVVRLRRAAHAAHRGRWNPRADFEETVQRHVPSLTPQGFAETIATGERFLAGASGTPERDTYRRVLQGALEVEASERLLAELRQEVRPPVVLELYPDVLPTLAERKRRGVRLAVVSDAWPDPRDPHEGLGIRGCFEVYALSAVLGCRKPGPRMYRYANDGLGLDPAHCLFVDDTPALVTAATALGDAGSSWTARESRETCGRSPPSATSCPSPDGLTLPRGKDDLDGRRDSRGAEGVDQDLGEPRRAFRRPLRYHASSGTAAPSPVKPVRAGAPDRGDPPGTGGPRHAHTPVPPPGRTPHRGVPLRGRRPGPSRTRARRHPARPGRTGRPPPGDRILRRGPGGEEPEQAVLRSPAARHARSNASTTTRVIGSTGRRCSRRPTAG
ncbi:HAD-IA family hydrolase [Streptomyces sp. GZWMJZ-114]|uniref:HAD-IA family hydrolase n=1 Tax=Streptomyces sp. GZWMJZ-114 TaxID=2494734 RepID=UPI00321F8A76